MRLGGFREVLVSLGVSGVFRWGLVSLGGLLGFGEFREFGGFGGFGGLGS